MSACSHAGIILTTWRVRSETPELNRTTGASPNINYVSRALLYVTLN